MKKRLISMLLAIVMVVGMIPGTALTAFAEETLTYDLWVGGVGLNDGEYLANGATEASGTEPESGYAHYALVDDTPTLTLNNYTYEGEGHNAAAIYYGGTDELKLVLEGTSSITQTSDPTPSKSYGLFVQGDLSVLGSGSLTATGGTTDVNDYYSSSTGVRANNVTVIAGSLTGIGGGGYRSYGVNAAKNIIVSGSGSLTGTGGKAQLSYGVYTPGGEGVTVTVSGSGSLTAMGGEATNSSYGVYAHYYACITVTDSGTLTGTGGVSTGQSVGVYASGDVTVSGSGSLTGEGSTGSSSDGVWSSGITVSGSGSLTGTGGTFTGERGSSYGVYAENNITVSGGVTVAQGKTAAFNKEPKIDESAKSNIQFWYGNNEEAANSNGVQTAYRSSKYVRISVPTPVASVTTTDGTEVNYYTISKAIEAVASATAEDNAVVKLLSDFTTDTYVTVQGGTFTIDLNSHTWTITRESMIIEGSADVTITDSSEGKTGKLLDNGKSFPTIRLVGSAKLEIAGGTVENGSGFYVVDMSLSGMPVQSQLVISGGTLTANGTNAIGAYGSSVTITGGKINAAEEHIYYQSGKIDLRNHKDPAGIVIYIASSVSNIPTINPESKTDHCILLPEGYVLKDASGTATTLEAGKTYTVYPNYVVAVTMNGATTQYTSLSKAVAAVASATADDNAVVKLLDDLTTTTTISVSGGVFTLDTNGKKLTYNPANGTGAPLWVNAGSNVTITGGGTLHHCYQLGSVVQVNGGTLTVEEVTISGFVDENGNQANGIAVWDGGNATINNGTISIISVLNSTLNINGGKVTGSVTYASYEDQIADGKIKGGEINGGVIIRGDIMATKGSNVEIADGTIAGGITVDGYYNRITLNGGTFTGGITVKGSNNTITLNGGTFTDGITLTDTYSTGITLRNILGEGMAYWQNGSKITLTEDQTEITGGDVTVSCAHTGEPTVAGKVDATCGADGYTGDTVCECGVTITKGETIPATGDHSYTVEVEDTMIPATCMAAGSVTMKCAGCDDTKVQTLDKDASNHTGKTTVTGKVDATCGADGYTGDTVCECGVTITKGETIPATGDHTFSTAWSYDETYHWHAATCGHDVTKDQEAHHGGTATAEAKAVCVDCGQSYGNLAVPVKTENTEKVKDITSENVQLEDLEDLESAKTDLEKALNSSDNLTKAEKEAIQEEIARISGAIESIEKVEAVTETVAKLPETVTPGNASDEAAVEAAQNAYNSLSAHEKTLVDEQTRKKLDAAVAALDVCDGGNNCPSTAFTDLKTTSWYHPAVDYVLNNGIMQGDGTTEFKPSAELTRAMLVQILYNMEGQPEMSGEDAFTDTRTGAWYANAVLWASSNGIVEGYGTGKFGPSDTLTREQMATILCRYAALKGMDTNASASLEGFKDAANISRWAKSSIQWAVAKGILNGFTDGTLRPNEAATRAQVAQIILNFFKK